MDQILFNGMAIKVQDNKVLMYVRRQFGLSPILIVYLCHICVLVELKIHERI